MNNYEMIEIIAEYIREKSECAEVITYQWGVTKEWLDDNAREIINELKKYYNAVYAGYDGKWFTVRYSYEMPNMYYWSTHNGQTFGVVMAYSEEDAKAKIGEDTEEFYMIEGDSWKR